MRLFPVSSSSGSSAVSSPLKVEEAAHDDEEETNRTPLYLNVYDLTPINNYLYWFGLGIFHSGIEVHGLEYGFGAHDYPTSGVFEVDPRSCPGFIFRRSILLGSINMTRSQFRLFIEHVSGEYHGDSYHLIAKNCNHFTDDVAARLIGKHIPGWVNRLARLGSFCNCILPQSLQVTSIRHLPDHHPAFSDIISESSASFASADSDEDDPDHRLLNSPTSDMPFSQERPIRLAKELL